MTDRPTPEQILQLCTYRTPENGGVSPLNGAQHIENLAEAGYVIVTPDDHPRRNDDAPLEHWALMNEGYNRALEDIFGATP